LKDAIAEAATSVLVREGLRGWSVEQVARAAGCAKGLVHYHHGTKRALLQAVAARLEAAHWERRLAPMAGSQDAQALDALWRALMAEVTSGEWNALLSLRCEAEFTAEAADDTARLKAFATRLAGALDLRPPSVDEARFIVAALDGIQLALHRGGDPTSLREAYHRLWLAVLP
jgi:AcrR family transcriptional regulator